MNQERAQAPGPERARETESELFRAIVEQAGEGVIFADRDGAIRVWNRGAESIFGYAAAEVMGSSLDVIIPERFRRAHWEGFHRAIASGQTKYGNRVLTTRSLHKNGGKLYLDMSFGVITNAAGEVVGALAVARDCTARQFADNALRARVAALEKNGTES
ncbi:MAG TPA: PAS domain S-box protein [Rhodocyclaceae bacterium]|nr:PAS domain S-box protein [Rhodocyclaceae bacterium]